MTDTDSVLFWPGPYSEFREAAKQTLELLQDKIGFDLWMVTRVDSNDCIVLETANKGYQIEPGAVLDWSISMCATMIEQRAPNIVPDVDQQAQYAERPIRQKMPIGAYIGMPLIGPDNRLFGTLCAFHPEAASNNLIEEQPFVEQQTRLLSTILQQELKIEHLNHDLRVANVAAHSDNLTKVFNRRGWEKFLTIEENRCKRYGSPCSVMIIDIDDLKKTNDELGHDAGDQLLIQTAAVLKNTVRGSDVIARLGGDEFAVMAIEANEQYALQLVERLRAALMNEGISASIGWASRDPKSDIFEACRRADHQMYLDKRSHKQLM